MAKTTLWSLVCGGLLGLGALAMATENRLFAGPPALSADGTQADIPIHLAVQQNLVLLAFRLAWDPSRVQFAPNTSVTLCPERFPWKTRSVAVSIDSDKSELVFSVGDLFGQNGMVLAGTGCLLVIPAQPLLGSGLQDALTVLSVQAYDLSLRRVPLLIDGDSAKPESGGQLGR